MQFSNDGVIWADPVPFAATATWSLTPEDGLKQVYARFKDSWGNWSDTVTDLITLDATMPLGTISINGGAAATNTISVLLSLSCSDGTGSGCYQMRFSNDGSSWSNLEAYSVFNTTKPWTLSSGDGVKTVYVQYSDMTGLLTSALTNTITLDTAAPDPPVFGGILTPTLNTQPTWSWTSGGSGGSGNYRYRLDNSDMSGATLVGTASFTPGSPLAGGTHTLYVQERDDLGNWSNTGSFPVIIDTTPPDPPLVTGPSSTFTRRPSWTWASGGNGGNGTYRFKLNDSNLESGATTTTNTIYVQASDLGDGSHTLHVQERDSVGNWCSSGLFSITVDATAPGAPKCERRDAYEQYQACLVLDERSRRRKWNLSIPA